MIGKSLVHLQPLSGEIQNCTKCSQQGEKARLSVNGFIKPSILFHTWNVWKPSRIKVVFIAEAPPGSGDGYFYNPDSLPGSGETLSRALFELLEIAASDRKRALDTFKERGYFLIDGIKCRCSKEVAGVKALEAVTRNCGRTWMQRELVEALGSPERICTLGRTAKIALSEVEGFSELDRYSAKKDCGSIVEIGKTKVLLWLYPGWRNYPIYSKKMEIFRSFCST